MSMNYRLLSRQNPKEQYGVQLGDDGFFMLHPDIPNTKEHAEFIASAPQKIADRNAMLAEMSGALAQIMGTAAAPDPALHPNSARYFAEALDRARAAQESYSRQLGNG